MLTIGGGSGKNVPIDLEIEHDNNSIKEGIRKLGPNLTRAAVARTARMLPVARGVVHNVSQECSLMKRSGKHCSNYKERFAETCEPSHAGRCTERDTWQALQAF